MKTLHVNTRTDEDGHLRIDMPLAQSATDISLIVIMEDPPPEKRKYDCSDLVGRLKWRGDAIKEQRILREQWS